MYKTCIPMQTFRRELGLREDRFPRGMSYSWGRESLVVWVDWRKKGVRVKQAGPLLFSVMACCSHPLVQYWNGKGKVVQRTIMDVDRVSR